MAEKCERSITGQLLLAVLAMTLPLWYALSAGPALWLCVNARLPAQWWNVFYWPLTLARDTIPGFHQWFQWYLDQWVR